jgi:hypothetical protein
LAEEVAAGGGEIGHRFLFSITALGVGLFCGRCPLLAGRKPESGKVSPARRIFWGGPDRYLQRHPLAKLIFLATATVDEEGKP